MEKKHQFLVFIVILLVVGFLNYLRKVTNGLRMAKIEKILYLCTMVSFVVGIMFILYFSEISNILSFFIGLGVMALSEQIGNMFVIVGNNFNSILGKFVKHYTKIDITEDLSTTLKKSIEEENEEKINKVLNK